MGLEMGYCSLIDPSWQGMGGNAGYSILAFFAGAFLVGVYLLAAITASLTRLVVREARENFHVDEDE